MTKWTKEKIRTLIETDARMVERSLLKLHGCQTPAEQNRQTTGEVNGVGFNQFDAALLSSLAEQIHESPRPEGRRLSDKQRMLAKRRLKKYAGQLLAHAQAT